MPHLKMLIMLLGLVVTSHAFSAQAMVLKEGGEGCTYYVLSAGGSDMLILRLIEGEPPQRRDIIEGEFEYSKDNVLTNKRTGKALKANLSETMSASRALTLHGTRCSP